MPEDDLGGVRITQEAIYRLLLEVRDEVRDLATTRAADREVVDDHGRRIHVLETLGSHHAQEAAKELERIRDWKHNLEGVVPTMATEMAQNIRSIATLERKVEAQAEAEDNRRSENLRTWLVIVIAVIGWGVTIALALA